MKFTKRRADVKPYTNEAIEARRAATAHETASLHKRAVEVRAKLDAAIGQISDPKMRASAQRS